MLMISVGVAHAGDRRLCLPSRACRDERKRKTGRKEQKHRNQTYSTQPFFSAHVHTHMPLLSHISFFPAPRSSAETDEESPSPPPGRQHARARPRVEPKGSTSNMPVYIACMNACIACLSQSTRSTSVPKLLYCPEFVPAFCSLIDLLIGTRPVPSFFFFVVKSPPEKKNVNSFLACPATFMNSCARRHDGRPQLWRISICT